MINKTLALIVIFSLAFNIAFVGIWAYTRVRPAPQRPAPARPVAPPAPAADGLWQQLGLTPEQQRSVVEEWRQVGHQVEGKQAEVRAQRARLIDLLQADVLDEQALRATRDKMDEDQQAVRELVFNRMPSRMPSSPRYAPQGHAATATRVGGCAPSPISPSPMNAIGRM